MIYVDLYNNIKMHMIYMPILNIAQSSTSAFLIFFLCGYCYSYSIHRYFKVPHLIEMCLPLH